MTTQSVFPIGGVAGAWRGDFHDQSRLDVLRHKLQRQWATWKLYRQTYEELMTLSDRDLNDIGIARCDIRSIARSTAEEAMTSQ